MQTAIVSLNDGPQPLLAASLRVLCSVIARTQGIPAWSQQMVRALEGMCRVRSRPDGQ